MQIRQLLLSKGRWHWLFGFENRDKLFDIDSRFKFCPVIVEKGGDTVAIQTAFMRRDVADWAVADRIAIPYRRDLVTRFSPSSGSILEIRSRTGLAILEKMYANSVLMGDQGGEGWGIRYAQGDFNMTSDSSLFHNRPAVEAKGYVADSMGGGCSVVGDREKAERRGMPPGRAGICLPA
ncbi:MAG: hypothetical protein IPJ95_05985 [Gemmatimonadetes bacterium]|nr:hypothetical protein [Gemmatimonadota bacterium]